MWWTTSKHRSEQAEPRPLPPQSRPGFRRVQRRKSVLAVSYDSGISKHGGSTVSTTTEKSPDGDERNQQAPAAAGDEANDATEFRPIPSYRCPECKRTAPDWYDERDRHMVSEFKAGTNTTRIAKGYHISQERVHQILIERIGTEIVLRISRTHARNDSEESANADTP